MFGDYHRFPPALNLVHNSQALRLKFACSIQESSFGCWGYSTVGSFESDLTHALTGRLSIALLMVDIDHFKHVNDGFAHPVGHEVLRAVAKVLTSKCDGRNRVEYRYGGEELALILTGDDAARATEVAESVRVDVEELQFDGYRDLRTSGP
jgi:diguanylate cyclase (GGDEF)-like protein